MFQVRLVELLLAAADGGAAGGNGPGADGPAAPDPFAFLRSLIFPMLLVFFIFWLLVFRPESRKRKERERMIMAVKKGDVVLTSGGILGKVWRVEPQEVVVVIDKDRDVKARFTKTAILDVVRDQGGKGGKGGKDARQESAEES